MHSLLSATNSTRIILLTIHMQTTTNFLNSNLGQTPPNNGSCRGDMARSHPTQSPWMQLIDMVHSIKSSCMYTQRNLPLPWAGCLCKLIGEKSTPVNYLPPQPCLHQRSSAGIISIKSRERKIKVQVPGITSVLATFDVLVNEMVTVNEVTFTPTHKY